jgi:hypothetical protein
MAVRMIKDGSVLTVADASDTGYKATEPRGLVLAGSDLIVADVFYPFPVTISVKPISFSDVKAEDADVIAKAVSRRLINGFADGTFKPDAPVTRAQFVTMLSRAQLYIDGQSVINGDAVFSDVPDGAWFARAINWAAAEQLMLGRVREGVRIADPSSILKASEVDHFMSRWYSKLELGYEPKAGDAPAAQVSRLQAVTAIVEMLEKAGY